MNIFTHVHNTYGKSAHMHICTLAHTRPLADASNLIINAQEEEPLPPDSPLYDVGHDKLLLTPHCADAVPDYWPASARTLVKNARLFGNGDPFPSLVNKKHGY
jgi:phosphoglycerate dehydrogenase-like enzyme